MTIVEFVGIQEFIKVHIGIVTFDYFSLRLKLADDFADSGKLFRRNFRGFVEENGIAELNLLDYKIFDVLVLDVFHHKGVTALKFALHPHGIHDCDDVVQAADPVLCVWSSKGRDAAYCLCNRFGFTYSTRLDYDVIEFFHGHDFANLLNQVCLECTADAPVLKGHETLVFLSYHSAFGNKVCVNVDFSYVIDNHSETYSSSIV